MEKQFYDVLSLVEREGIEDLIKWLKETEFEKTPASTRYHLAEEGGLLEHSLNVYKVAVELHQALDSKIPRESVVLTALLHDIGKHHYFNKEYYKKKPLLKSGKVPAQPYERNKDRLPVPHEVASIQTVSSFIELTEEESWAILHHNGMYGDLKYSLQGNEKPLQMIIHMADMWASRVLE